MFYKYMYKQRSDNPRITEVFNDFQEKLGVIKLVTIPGKKEWEATVFTPSIKRSFSSIEQAKRFIESNAWR